MVRSTQTLNIFYHTRHFVLWRGKLRPRGAVCALEIRVLDTPPNAWCPLCLELPLPSGSQLCPHGRTWIHSRETCTHHVPGMSLGQLLCSFGEKQTPSMHCSCVLRRIGSPRYLGYQSPWVWPQMFSQWVQKSTVSSWEHERRGRQNFKDGGPQLSSFSFLGLCEVFFFSFFF